MKRLVIAASVAVLTTIPTLAADLPVRGPAMAPAPVFVAVGWSGFYAGVNAGWVRGSFEHSATLDPAYPLPAPEIDRVTRDLNRELSKDGFTGGVQIGWNAQSGSLVYGVEADLNYVGLRANSGLLEFGAPVPPGNFFESRSRSEWLATLRARLGFSTGAALFYVTGGLAAAELKSSTLLDFVGGVGAGARSTTQFGWAAGAGVEYKLTPNWSAKLEYLYADLGKHSYTTGPIVGFPTANTVQRVSYNTQMVRLGLNYQFNSPTAAVY